MNLNGKGEAELYQEFYGNLLEQMPLLIEGGYKPISVAGTIDRRESAPADVVDGWRRNYIFTGDGAAYDGRKNAKLVLDAALLREISPDTKLDNYVMVLSNDQWEELRGDKVLCLDADKVDQVHKKGFVKRNGVWQPENAVVGDVWEHLSRGKDLKKYLEMVSEASNSKKLMWLWFDRNNYDSPVMRSLVLGSIDYYSYAIGNLGLDYVSGRLVGVAAEPPYEIANPGVKVSAYRGHIPMLEKMVEEVTEENKSELITEEELREIKPWYRRIFTK